MSSSRILVAAATALFLTTPMLASAQAVEWVEHKSADGSYPSPTEQKMLYLLNRARTNPSAEGAFLQSLVSDPSIAHEYNAHGVNLGVMNAEITALTAVAPLAYNHDLAESQREHNLWLIKNNENRSHGSLVAPCYEDEWANRADLPEQACRANDHFSRFDYYYVRINLAAQADSAAHYHASLTVDWGVNPFTLLTTNGMQSPRGHRTNRFDADATLIGIAAEKDKDPDTTLVGKLAATEIITKDRVETDRRYLIGTVWQDRNLNGIYDEGEGVPGVRVEPENGRYFAVTGAAGGYNLPIEPLINMSFPQGGLNVTFTQGDIELPVNHIESVQFTNENVLLDYKISGPSVLMTQSDDSDYIWLDRSIADPNVYTATDLIDGAVTAQFENLGEDYLLMVKGHDLDKYGFEVFLNGVALGYLKKSPDNDAKNSKFYIPRELQQAGRNDIEIRYNADTDGVWNLSKIILRKRSVPTVDLDFGRKDTAKYGNKTGTKANLFVARYAIDMPVSSADIQVKGFSLDSINRVELFVNGTSQGYLMDGVQVIPAVSFNANEVNILEFRHVGPYRGEWGVGNVQVGN